MIHTFQLDDSNPKAKALLDFLRTFDFIKEENNMLTFNEDLNQALEDGLESINKNGGVPHEDVMRKMKEKYPNLFRA